MNVIRRRAMCPNFLLMGDCSQVVCLPKGVLLKPSSSLLFECARWESFILLGAIYQGSKVSPSPGFFNVITCSHSFFLASRELDKSTVVFQQCI